MGTIDTNDDFLSDSTLTTCDQCGETRLCRLQEHPSDYVEEPASWWCWECAMTAGMDR